MYDNDRNTSHSRNPEDTQGLSLWATRGCGHRNSLSAGVQETRQEETGLVCLYIIGVDSI